MREIGDEDAAVGDQDGKMRGKKAKVRLIYLNNN